MLAILGLGLFTSCDDDNDANPTISVPETFKLNTPAIAENNVIDLANTETLTLTCDQPDYGGFPLAVDYKVQISTDEAFSEANTFDMPMLYNTTTIALAASSINTTIIERYQAVNGENTFPEGEFPLYIRLIAQPTKVDVSPVTSNAIVLPRCVATYKAPDVVIPENIYICGSFIDEAFGGKAWEKWFKLANAFATGSYYTVVYIPEDGQFKFGTKEGDWTGFSALAAVNAPDGVDISGNDDDNIVFSKAGWYTLEFVANISGGTLNYTLKVSPAVVYVTGNGIGGFPADHMLAMTPPADNSGEWVSPAFTASGELRAYVDVPGRDWYRTEFTLKDGTEVFYRTIDMPNNWKETYGDAYSVTVSPGKKLYINFASNTGKVE